MAIRGERAYLESGMFPGFWPTGAGRIGRGVPGELKEQFQEDWKRSSWRAWKSNFKRIGRAVPGELKEQFQEDWKSSLENMECLA